MALADYFPRDAVAISQVLQGFEIDAFTERLKGIGVTISFGEEAATSRDGRDLLDLSVRLAARLYPRLTFATVPAGDRITDELMELSSSINPNIELSRTDTSDVALAVGMDAPAVDSPTVYAGCDGWVALVGTDGPFSINNLGNPFGAGFASCLAAANLFRFLFLPDGEESLDVDFSFPPDADSYPSIQATALSDPLVLVGVGAVGNSAAWALARVPLSGQIYLVDPEDVELGNLQRYILGKRNDEGAIKVELVEAVFRDTLRALPFHGTWASFVENKGYQWERVLVALDSARDRRAVQGSLPCWIANAWTQNGDLGVSTHSFLGPDACLACLYLPTEKSTSEDQIIAEGLKVPQLQDRIRILLGSGSGTERDVCEAIAAAWDIPISKLEHYIGRPIRELWVQGICGGGIIPLGDIGTTPREQQVPLTFQSALAGLLLAGETMRDVLNAGAHRKTLVRRLDVMRPIGEPSMQPSLKAGTGNCICEDPDFVAAYRNKYELENSLTL